MQPDLPPTDEHGMLPPGVHDCSLDDIERLFGQVQRSTRRCRLFAGLKEYVEALRDAGIAAQVIIDGSFVMGSVDEPEDIDLVLVLPVDWDFYANLPPYLYNLIVKRRVAQRFGFDVVSVAAGSTAQAQWIDFFQLVGPKWRDRLSLPADHRKGILRVTL